MKVGWGGGVGKIEKSKFFCHYHRGLETEKLKQKESFFLFVFFFFSNNSTHLSDSEDISGGERG